MFCKMPNKNIGIHTYSCLANLWEEVQCCWSVFPRNPSIKSTTFDLVIRALAVTRHRRFSFSALRKTADEVVGGTPCWPAQPGEAASSSSSPERRRSQPAGRWLVWRGWRLAEEEPSGTEEAISRNAASRKSVIKTPTGVGEGEEGKDGKEKNQNVGSFIAGQNEATRRGGPFRRQYPLTNAIWDDFSRVLLFLSLSPPPPEYFHHLLGKPLFSPCVTGFE